MTSYQGVEDLSNFSSDQALRSYRNSCLDSFMPMCNFIKSLLGQLPVNCVDVGSGNSSLLINLFNSNMLKTGIAIEPAQSRNAFAKKWAADEDISCINHICDYFENVYIHPNSVDLFICNSTFHLLSHVRPDLPRALLDLSFNSLRSGGILVMDIPTHRKKLSTTNNGLHSFVKTSSSGSAIRYSVYDLIKQPETNFVRSASKYYCTNGNLLAHKEDIFYSYSLSELNELLASSSFKSYSLYSSLDITSQANDNSDNIFLVATKY